MDGGEGNDTADFSEFSAAIRIDSLPMRRGMDHGHGRSLGRDLRKVASLVSIENLTGGSGNDELTGNDGANRINGGAGNDTIHGGGGNDTSSAGSGIDSVYGDGGDDTLVATYEINPFAFDLMDGGTGTDTADFSSFKDRLPSISAASACGSGTTNRAIPREPGARSPTSSRSRTWSAGPATTSSRATAATIASWRRRRRHHPWRRRQ